MLDTKRSAMKIPAGWKTTWCLGAFVAMMLAPRGEALAAERQLTEAEQAQINSYAELAKERRQANDHGTLQRCRGFSPHRAGPHAVRFLHLGRRRLRDRGGEKQCNRK